MQTRTFSYCAFYAYALTVVDLSGNAVPVFEYHTMKAFRTWW